MTTGHLPDGLPLSGAGVISGAYDEVALPVHREGYRRALQYDVGQSEHHGIDRTVGHYHDYIAGWHSGRSV